MKKYTCLALSIAIIFIALNAVQSSHSGSKEGYESIAIDSSEDRIFGVNGGKEGIDVIDIATSTVIKTILGDKNIEAVAIDERKNILAAAEKKYLHIISTETFETSASVPIGEKPTSVTIASDLGLALVTHKEHGVVIINLNTYNILTEISTEKKPVSSAVDPGLGIAVIAHHAWDGENEKAPDVENDNVTIIDLKTFAVVKTLKAGKNPRHVAINPETHFAVVANEKSNDLTIIDLQTMAITGTFSVQKHPKASSFNVCLNTLSVISGEDKSWLQVIDAESWTIKASYSFDYKLRDVAVHPYMNIAAIAGKNGLSIQDLPNPAPELVSISPNSAQRGGAAFNVALTGKGLLAATEIYLNGNKSGSTFLTCGSMSALLPDTYLTNAGTVEIKAVNPAPDGGTSNILYLTVNNPVPAITELQPSEITAGSPGQTLKVTGSGFFPETVVYVNNSQRTFTLIDGTRIEIQLTETELAAAGSITIMATNPSPGGGDSQVAVLTVTKPASNVDPLPEGSYGKQYEDLVPSDATIEAYTPKRFAIVTGLVKDRNQNPISGVKVSFRGLSEYGSAITDAEGRYSLPVDGGGTLTVVYEKAGLITSHRQVNTPWNDIVNAETITMLPEDTKATTITFDGNPTTILTHASTPVTDEFGTRTLTMVFSGDNRAVATNADGQQTVLTSFTTRATEFDTPESMPAKLPPTSAYTYCSELSVDGAKNVRFDKPVTVYVDNFLGFPAGEIVPVGYYDRQRGVWVASDNGKVVKLLDTSGDGIVDALDSTGDGQADDLDGDGAVNDEAAGLTDPERYKPNSTYWRVSMNHFTPWDCNWPYGPPEDATPPTPEDEPTIDEQQDDDDTDCTGSYCERRSRVFHEDIPLMGTDMTLHYASNRVPGYKTTVTIPTGGQTVPGSLTKIIVRMELAGRVFETTLPPLPNQKVEYIWNGLDYLGNPVIGSTTANISIGFGYWLEYYSSPNDFMRAWARVGNSATAIRGRLEYFLWKHNTLTLKNSRVDSLSIGFGKGWTLSAHHYVSPFDPNILFKGDGTISDNNASVITTIAGNGQGGYSGDGGPAAQASLYGPIGVEVDSAGNIFIVDITNSRIRKMDANDIITTIAGNGQRWSFGGDGGPATQASLGEPVSVAVNSAGNIYIADSYNGRIRRVNTSGVITTVAGGGQHGIGDGGFATQASLYYPTGVALDSGGNIYIADSGNNRIRKVDTNGIITTIAGNGQWSYSGDGGPAIQATLDHPYRVAVDTAGNIYIADYNNYRIRKVDTSGIITTVAGSGPSWCWGGGYMCYGGFSGDGGPATQAKLEHPHGVTVDNAGNLYIVEGYNHRIRRVDTSGIITTVAGSGPSGYYWYGGFSGDGGPATQARLYYPTGVAVDSAGYIYIADTTNNRIRKVSYPDIFTPHLMPGDIAFSEDNGLGYLMSSTGQHKSTIDLATGKTLLTFGYNDDDQLISVTDRFANQTTIQRDANGTPTSITSPDGQVTKLTIDGSDHLTKVTYSDGSSYAFGYTSDGLMTDEYDPNNNHFIHKYDSNGRITEINDPEGGTWTYLRSADNSGNIISTVHMGEGNSITYKDHTDSTGAYTSTKTDPNGETTTISRTSDGLSEKTTTSCGMTVSKSYNLDTEYLFKYVSAATTTTSSGLKLASAYSRTYKDTNSDNVKDLITDLVSKNTRTWATTNNTLSGTITSTSPMGRTITSQYDPETLLTQNISMPGLNPTTFAYDNRGRLVSSETGSRTMTISYDDKGNVASLTDALGNTTTYNYDDMSRVTQLHAPNSDITSFGYDANGNMTMLTNPNDVSNEFDYTGNDQRKTWATPLSGEYQYTYDKERKLKTVTFPSGKTISNTYTNGLLTSTTTPEGAISYSYGCGSNISNIQKDSESVSYTYDGSLIKTDTRAGALNQAINYKYNNDFKLSSIIYSGATYSFGYDNDGLLTSAGTYTITRNAQNGLPETVTDGKLKISRVFNGYGEMDESTYTINNTPLYDWTITRDNVGRITQKSDNMQGSAITWDYAYDKLGRLTEVKQNNVVVESYTYDANGNRLTESNTLRGISSKSYSYSTEDQVLTAGTDTYQFDNDGFLTSKITSDGTTTLNYSSRGELLSATLPNGTAISYDHDPMGRRIAKKVNGAVTEKYLWQGLTRLLAVYDGSNNLLIRFIYADGRMPVSMTKGGVTYYLFYDQIGSLRAVTDASGVIVKEVLYDSFGAIIYDSNSSLTVPFGFAGGLHDRDTGLVRFGFRDYDPAIGRWTAKDPIDFAGGDVNLFGYVGGNSINLTDPLGLQAACQYLPPEYQYYDPTTWPSIPEDPNAKLIVKSVIEGLEAILKILLEPKAPVILTPVPTPVPTHEPT